MPAVPTPFDERLAVDLDGLRAILDRLLAKEVDRVTILGSSGEVAYLLPSEREQVVRAAVDHLGGRARVIAGVAQYGTRQAVEEAKRMAGAGADTLLVGLPQYFRTPLRGIVDHYAAIVESVDVPVLYYHYPAVFGLRLRAHEVAQLFARVPLAGSKHSALSTPGLASHLRAIGRPAAVFTGLSLNLHDALHRGACGAICPLQVLQPSSARQIVAAVRAGDPRAARAAQARLYRALPLLTGEGARQGLAKLVVKVALKTGIKLPASPGLAPAAIKEALRELGVIRCAKTRSPQRELTDGECAMVRALARRVAEI